jgi:hypothetical protein
MDARLAMQAASAIPAGLGSPAPLVSDTVPCAHDSPRVTDAATLAATLSHAQQTPCPHRSHPAAVPPRHRPHLSSPGAPPGMTHVRRCLGRQCRASVAPRSATRPCHPCATQRATPLLSGADGAPQFRVWPDLEAAMPHVHRAFQADEPRALSLPTAPARGLHPRSPLRHYPTTSCGVCPPTNTVPHPCGLVRGSSVPRWAYDRVPRCHGGGSVLACTR